MKNNLIKDYLQKEVVEQLQNARDLITDPNKWTKRSFAKDSHGNSVSATSSRAVCFCSIGALEHVSNGIGYEKSLNILQSIAPLYTTVIVYNDSYNTTHDDILKLFDVAIEKAKSEIGI